VASLWGKVALEIIVLIYLKSWCIVVLAKRFKLDFDQGAKANSWQSVRHGTDHSR
jgi:hypothetical protein